MPAEQVFTVAEHGRSFAVQDWVKELGAKGDPREAAAMAMVKMIETRDLVPSAENGRTSKAKPVSQSEMSAFIEDLVPGKSCRSPAAAAAAHVVLPLPLPLYKCTGREARFCDFKRLRCSLGGRTCQ